MKRTDITDIFPEASKEQIDKILGINGADINAAKGDSEGLRSQLAAAQAEIEKIKARPAEPDAGKELQALKDELAGLKLANSLRDLREKVSKDTGVPASLLTAETEEACKTQAEAIKAYSAQQAKPTNSYPNVKDGGEAGSTGGSATRDKFANWMEQNFPSAKS